MALDPHFKIEEIEMKWIKGKCAICTEPCEPDGYLHSACAVARDNYLNDRRKKYWEDWKKEKDLK